jgi:hypothetical protein
MYTDRKIFDTKVHALDLHSNVAVTGVAVENNTNTQV